MDKDYLGLTGSAIDKLADLLTKPLWSMHVQWIRRYGRPVF